MDYLKALPGQVDFDYLHALQTEQIWNKGYGPKYQQLLENLPFIPTRFGVKQGVVELLGETEYAIKSSLEQLKSWRKGPFRIFGHHIESEWRSDFKWERLLPNLPQLQGKNILDIGANNGYFMFRMLEHNPELVLGIEPTLLYKTQFELINRYVRAENLKMETFGVEHLSAFQGCFDVIFSMGILYHHRSPLTQLKDMRGALCSGGTLVLETIGIPGEEAFAITPEDRYAGMRNVWLLPTLPMLIRWLERSKFVDIKIVSTHWEASQEQRVTDWSSEVSYQDFLDQDNQELTKEGLPAPRRFIITANRK